MRSHNARRRTPKCTRLESWSTGLSCWSNGNANTRAPRRNYRPASNRSTLNESAPTTTPPIQQTTPRNSRHEPRNTPTDRTPNPGTVQQRTFVRATTTTGATGTAQHQRRRTRHTFAVSVCGRERPGVVARIQRGPNVRCANVNAPALCVVNQTKGKRQRKTPRRWLSCDVGGKVTNHRYGVA